MSCDTFAQFKKTQELSLFVFLSKLVKLFTTYSSKIPCFCDLDNPTFESMANIGKTGSGLKERAGSILPCEISSFKFSGIPIAALTGTFIQKRFDNNILSTTTFGISEDSAKKTAYLFAAQKDEELKNINNITQIVFFTTVYYIIIDKNC
jgi:hypothetical protein